MLPARCPKARALLVSPQPLVPAQGPDHGPSGRASAPAHAGCAGQGLALGPPRRAVRFSSWGEARGAPSCRHGCGPDGGWRAGLTLARLPTPVGQPGRPRQRRRRPTRARKLRPAGHGVRVGQRVGDWSWDATPRHGRCRADRCSGSRTCSRERLEAGPPRGFPPTLPRARCALRAPPPPPPRVTELFLNGSIVAPSLRTQRPRRCPPSLCPHLRHRPGARRLASAAVRGPETPHGGGPSWGLGPGVPRVRLPQVTTFMPRPDKSELLSFTAAEPTDACVQA